MRMCKHGGRLRAAVPVLLVFAVAAAWTAPVARAAGTAGKSPRPTWVYPVIKEYGGVHPRPNLPVRPDPKVHYKIFADVVSDDRNPAGQYEGFVRLARLVNLMAYAKVPSDHVHIVALPDGTTGWAAATNAVHQQQFNADNPTCRSFMRSRGPASSC